MRWAIVCLSIFGIVFGSQAQLVRKRDFDAAFALQAGGEIAGLTPFHRPGIAVKPLVGLKMTFPFNRKWFLGSEINYNELKYSEKGGSLENWEFPSEGEQTVAFRLRQLRIPVYLKYRLSCNKASLLFGFYGAYVPDAKAIVSFSSPELYVEKDISDCLDCWHAGIMLGYEHRIVKHLNMACQVDIGIKEIVKKPSLFKDRLFPLQASITLSYDLLRIGDCDCD